MNSSTRTKINKLATEVLNVVYHGNITFPVDVDKLVSLLGGKVKFDPTLDTFIDATISKKKGKFEIKMKPGLPENRRRFTLAHELGHFFLHMNDTQDEEVNYVDGAFCRNENDNGEFENQAHEFAGALLMPEDEYRRYITEIVCDNRVDVNKIAEHFRVSYDAALVRGKWLGVFSW